MSQAYEPQCSCPSQPGLAESQALSSSLSATGADSLKGGGVSDFCSYRQGTVLGPGRTGAPSSPIRSPYWLVWHRSGLILLCRWTVDVGECSGGHEVCETQGGLGEGLLVASWASGPFRGAGCLVPPCVEGYHLPWQSHSHGHQGSGCGRLWGLLVLTCRGQGLGVPVALGSSTDPGDAAGA